ncbi:MAG TPA: S8/S53 family peptidase [Acidimicrobiales bacterium]|nr:S8/S53 family peptidase [Acidimicrobiales bacterium]
MFLAAALLGVGPSLRSAGADERVVTGTIKVPTASVARGQRCIATTAPDLQQGNVGWTISGVTPGRAFTVKAADTSGVQDFEIAFYPSLAACQDSATGLPHTTVAGDEQGVVPAGAAVALVTLYSGTPGAEFTYREYDFAMPAREGRKPVTVVAVVDGGFSPYHLDFRGSEHPFNRNADPSDDIDFTADPATYIDAMPATTPLTVTLPADPAADVSTLADGPDKEAFAQIEPSTPEDVKLYRFPGTKIIAAADFAEPDGIGPVPVFDPQPFYGDNDSHGTRSAAVAAGNIHGTCPECVFVLINGTTPKALAWAASQPWIDVVTNSYGHNTVGDLVLGQVRDNIYFGSPIEATRQAVEDGQTIVFSAGNGFANAFDVPMLTYWSSEKGPDWMVTVGAVDPRADQQYSGAGKPVDISSYGSSYPSTGGPTANGEGEHSGTSNAAPVTAGTFAAVIQRGRELLVDLTEGHSGGVVASGQAVACGPANADCPLGDGVLTRAEVQKTVFENVLPSHPGVAADTVWPSTQFNYYYQGHGVIGGRMNQQRYLVEQQRFADALVGSVASFPRPAGERNWMTVDSKCRQGLWGAWTGGYFDGTRPALDPVADPIASAFDKACSQAPDRAFADVAKLVAG